MANQYGYRCPVCGSEDHLDVQATTVIWARLGEHGDVVTDEVEDLYPMWDADSYVACTNTIWYRPDQERPCGWDGTIGELADNALRLANEGV